MKLTFSKKEWDSLGSTKIAQTAPAPAQKIDSKQAQPQPQQGGNTYYAHYKLEKETGDTVITVTDEGGRIFASVRTGSDARENARDIISDYEMMKNIDDLSGLKYFLVRFGVIRRKDNLVKAK